MVVRSWTGDTTAENAERYVAHLRRSVVPELERLEGFRGIYVLRRPSDSGFAFQVLTLWTPRSRSTGSPGTTST